MPYPKCRFSEGDLVELIPGKHTLGREYNKSIGKITEIRNNDGRSEVYFYVSLDPVVTNIYGETIYSVAWYDKWCESADLPAQIPANPEEDFFGKEDDQSPPVTKVPVAENSSTYLKF